MVVATNSRQTPIDVNDGKSQQKEREKTVMLIAFNMMEMEGHEEKANPWPI